MYLLAIVNLCLSARAAQTQGSLSILSYNVAGLPELLSSGNPSVNTPLISPRLKPYNIIHVQEDFNFHAALYASDTHAFRTSTSGGAGIGSGLNTLSDFPFIDFERTKWDNCNLNEGDCLTPKGFTFMRVRASDGVWIDFYNLHMDAGSDSGDVSSRRLNLAQLSSFIGTRSVGMPVVIMGDTNGRYTRPGDSEALRSFISTNVLLDSWVTNVRGGSFPTSGSPDLVCDFPFADGTTQSQMVACEVVDKILTRSSPAVTVRSSAFINENEAFVNGTGAPLSDHYPILSRLAWQLSSSFRLADPVGGPHGDPFNDLSRLSTATSPVAAIPRLVEMTVRGGERVDGISYKLQFDNGTITTVTHGGTGGTPATLSFSPTNTGEHVVQIQACSGSLSGRTRVFFVMFITNLGRTLQAGKITSDCSITGVPTDPGSGGAQWGLIGFWGRSGDEMDRFGAIWGAAY